MRANEAGFNLREISPLSHKTLHSRSDHPDEMGQRMRQRRCCNATDYRNLLLIIGGQKGFNTPPVYGVDVRDTAKSGMGCTDNRHLNYSVESLLVNVGGAQPNVKVSSLPMSGKSVGGVIVLGVRESRIQGEGHQGINVSPVESTSESDEFRTPRKGS